jgi:hypothetical protein
VPIRDPAYVKPDPLIYSQYFLAAKGLAYTWDNPDITLFHNGIPVPSSQLQAATTYQVRARVWNNSTECPVVQMPVHLSFLSFGMGTVSHPVGTTKIDVSVKGGAVNPAFVTLPWTTPPEAGHYCLQVLLDPADDLEFGNNLGQENTDVGVAHSPALFTFQLRNDTRRQHDYTFQVDGYTLPARPPCGDAKGGREQRLARHRRGAHPLPAGWAVDLQPTTPTLAPGDEITVTATVTPPDDFRGRQAVNVNAYYHAYHDDQMAGGVTMYVTRGE